VGWQLQQLLQVMTVRVIPLIHCCAGVHCSAAQQGAGCVTDTLEAAMQLRLSTVGFKSLEQLWQAAC
jgi:hypothetical protein